MCTTNNNSVYWFIFFNNQLLVQKKDRTYTIPDSQQPPVSVIRQLKIGYFNARLCMAATVDVALPETDDYLPVDLRVSYDFLDKPFYDQAGKAAQLLFWDKNSRYCPACGTETVQISSISKQCPVCKYELYPPISAAVLVLVKKEDAILLVHARNFKGTFNSLVAGFLETGETLEECAAREVMEETGIQICNIKYYGNQPWPYPSNLMIGFIADYAGGTIQLQEDELSSGAFYARNHLPELPRKLSLARKMIDWWLEQV